ncbi:MULTISPECIES: hypothetical protein [unclassified Beijerinckia]|uniref:hypothetical protein n=1 Tax=unclassified Beijerinckia TaxID=2638183 RepID=UPI00147EC957|nr:MULTISPECIES: hypothetical protein [unclassified Beijerinckia]MDH7797607.1 hypothetical protein [Beijerinckia sp. GAS462]
MNEAHSAPVWLIFDKVQAYLGLFPVRPGQIVATGPFVTFWMTPARAIERRKSLKNQPSVPHDPP